MDRPVRREEMAVAVYRQLPQAAVQEMGDDVADAPGVGDGRPFPVGRLQTAEQTDQLRVERGDQVRHIPRCHALQVRHTGPPFPWLRSCWREEYGTRLGKQVRRVPDR